MSDWRAQAACRGLDPELFFPGHSDHATLAAAKAVCRTCPVAEECLAYAMEDPDRMGVWAGTSHKQRRAIRRAAGVERRCDWCGATFRPVNRQTYCGLACRSAAKSARERQAG